ncbi:metalloregulator ArsR/SmtB family transcription factor [Bacillus haynesii]|uniref:ArsR/SmtB family transcription factor n=1 Tax=Bacillus haynesii TaxID=1925021 RepID=UPI00227E2081|nr:metalloregulator ArsR/SmtB family transcription factor [Bacillus haynesii]MCY8045899.1 metalloregulator ArsR/SmtB family transcription factor [Bacillus haynesii]MCY8080673.1 metalloregulator ArsR/SmtB family transcription factor [Bacillus haynesii]MCY8342891.1 metalloregulator ArsR/SmtB family transcription factor [Bacillus haynesii]MCY8385558.1 metalloregulator ArsR/SmtB family transcription factor [Bacillus haynesii]MCY8590721.1 metalloregulator ArsR/SmtB family transcription factor [Baci
MTVQTKLDSKSTVSCMKILSDSTRLLILKLLQEKPYCVCQFVDMFETSQPAISQHLRKLKSANMIKEERREQWRFYSLHDDFPERELVFAILNQIDEHDEVLQTVKRKERPVSCQ